MMKIRRWESVRENESEMAKEQGVAEAEVGATRVKIWGLSIKATVACDEKRATVIQQGRGRRWKKEDKEDERFPKVKKKDRPYLVSV